MRLLYTILVDNTQRDCHDFNQVIKKKALIIVDLQNDFCPGGSLAIQGGHDLVPIANLLMPLFDVVVATQDWHPSDHVSFDASHAGHRVGDTIMADGLPQILWPIHCTQATHGAEFYPGLNLAGIHHLVKKGIDKKIDSYSAFFDNAHQRDTGLADYLRNQGVQEIYLMGLIIDYCVKFSALDAVQLKFKTHVIVDACRGAELVQGDIARACEEMRNAGVKLINVADVTPTRQR